MNPIAHSPSMKDALHAALDVAGTAATVLLTGESGTGKEVIARYIHEHSPRSSKAWVAVNCAALPGELLENELFGHEKGAFTGASERRTGRVEQANGGTLLLDEVSELPLLLQAKLLRVIQERELDRVGGTRPIQVDVRIIATSNRDLAQMVADGKFRADLYYRLNVFPIELPALRDRPEDVTPLAVFMLAEAAATMGRPVPGLSASAVTALHSYPFPGNVRELRNLLERALVRCRAETLSALDLGFGGPTLAPRPTPPVRQVAGLPMDLPLNLEALERLAIMEALRRVNGNRTHAARLLGIGLRTLRTKLNVPAQQSQEAEAA